MRIPFLGKYRTLNTVRVSKDALRHNLNLYRKLLPDVEICPVLKSNAYGHGLVEVAQVVDEEKPAFIIVDSLYEAYELQKAGIESKILILGYTFPENLERKRLPFHFVISDLESAKSLGKQGANVHLKVDTGMNRMGFSVDDLPEVLKELEGMDLDVVGVLTHLADADNPDDNDYDEMQEARFKEALGLIRQAGFRPKWIHGGGASGGALLKNSNHPFNMLRLGFSMYGISPFEEFDPVFPILEGLSPVMELRSTLVGIRALKKGDRVSYNGTFEADHDMIVGIVPVGYYEALPRVLSNQGMMEVRGEICPIVGRICMNYSVVNLTDVDNPEIGDDVVVYSRDLQKPNTLRNLAKLANTIPYELMTRVAESVRREVV